MFRRNRLEAPSLSSELFLHPHCPLRPAHPHLLQHLDQGLYLILYDRLIANHFTDFRLLLASALQAILNPFELP